jgi:hypothetical protein
MDAIKILAALAWKLRDEQDEVVLTAEDANAALVSDRTNVEIRLVGDALHIRPISTADAQGGRNAEALRRGQAQPWRPPVNGRLRS